MPRALRITACLLAAWAAHACAADAATDPFLQIGAGIANCPPPRPPAATADERRAEAHQRIERGTSCWLSGDCTRSSAYDYDAGIAAAMRERLAAAPAFGAASLWVTVRRRIVFVDGCVPPALQAREIEAWMQALPDVERVIVNVYSDLRADPPYRRAVAPPAPAASAPQPRVSPDRTAR